MTAANSVKTKRAESELLAITALKSRHVFLQVSFSTRSGDIELPITAGTFRNAGWLAVDWSSRAADASGAYRLVIYATVYPSGDTTNNRYNGFPLRCSGLPRFGADLFST